MIARFQAFLAPTSPDPDVAHRQYILNIVLLGLAGPGFLFGVVMTVLWILRITPVTGAIAGLGVQPFYLLSYWLNRRGRVTLAAYIPAAVVFLVMTASSWQVGIGHVTMIGFAMVVTTAGVLIGLGAAVLFVLLSIAAYALTGVAQASGWIPQALLPEAAIAADAIGMALGLSVLVVLNWLSNREMVNALQRERTLANRLQQRSQDLEVEVEDRTRDLQRQTTQLQTTTEIAKLSAELTVPEDLISLAIELIRDRFDFYHTSIFLIDETGTWADLAASSGEIGRTMLSRGYRLAVGSASIIGWVTANRIPRVASDVEEDPFYFKNPLLPDTRSEMAVPLIVGQRLLGALDIQSTEKDAFSEDDVRTMEAIAGELAIAIDSARAQGEMRHQLDRYETAYREQARESWGRMIRSGMPSEIRLSHYGKQTDATEVEFITLETTSPRTETLQDETGREIAVPVIVRGEVIASIAARKPEPTGTWTAEEIALLEAVASQAALSLETARQRADEQRRMTELEAINRISQAVSQILRLDLLYRLVHNQINHILGEVDLYIATYDPELDQISFPYASEKGETVTLPTIPLGEGLTSLVIRSRQPLIIVEDTERIAASLGARQVGVTAKSWMGVPMMVGDDVVGIITIQDPEHEHRFTEDDAGLMSTIASQVAAALQNTRLLEQVQRAERRERLTRQITSRVRRSPDFKTILQTTARELGQALHAVRATASLGAQAENQITDSVPEDLTGTEDSLTEPPVEEQDR